MYKGLYDDADMRQFFVRKDLFEILEKAIDRCRDVGNIVYQIVLKTIWGASQGGALATASQPKRLQPP